MTEERVQELESAGLKFWIQGAMQVLYAEIDETRLGCAFLEVSVWSGAATRVIPSPTSRYSMDMM